MNYKNHSIAAHYLKVVLAGAKRCGFNEKQLLDKAGISSSLANQPKARIAPDKVSQLIQVLWREMDDEFLGFTGDRCKYGTFAILAKQVIGCRSLGEVLRQSAHFYHVIRNDIDMRFTVDDEYASFSIELKQPNLDPDYFFIEFLLLVWPRFSNWLTGQSIPLYQVRLSYPAPSHVEEYNLMFPSTCIFNAEQNSIVFYKESLSLPVVKGEHELNVFLRNAPVDLLIKPVFYRTYTTQVIDLIGSLNSPLLPDFEWVASQFHMTSRNLRRHLREEKTTYQKIKDRLRRDKAIFYLTRQELSISQIAREVGYNEPAVFTRAFKQWTGVSPRAYRNISLSV